MSPSRSDAGLCEQADPVVLKSGTSGIRMFPPGISARCSKWRPGIFGPGPDENCSPRWPPSTPASFAEQLTTRSLHSTCRGGNGASKFERPGPIEAHPTPLCDVSAEHLAFFALEDDGRTRTITTNGITWRNRPYIAPWTVGHTDTKIRLRHLPYHDSEIEVFNAATGHHLGAACLAEPASPEQVRAPFSLAGYSCVHPPARCC